MVFSSIILSSGADQNESKQFNNVGESVGMQIQLPLASEYVPPGESRTYALTTEISSLVGGGLLSFFVGNQATSSSIDEASVIQTDTYDPPGSLSATRYAVTLALAKVMRSGQDFVMGITQRSTNSIGWKYKSGTPTDADHWNADWTKKTANVWKPPYLKLDYNVIPRFPTSLVASAGGLGGVHLSWTAPSNDGHGNSDGSAITGYRIEYSTSSAMTSPTVIADTGSSATSYTVTGLTPGATYYFRVAALNDVTAEAGAYYSKTLFSQYSNKVSAIPSGVGKRFDGTTEVNISQAYRWDGSAEVPITIFKRWNGTGEV